MPRPVESRLRPRKNKPSNRPVARSLSIREYVAKSKSGRYNGRKCPVNSNTNSDNNIANHETITTGYQIDELMRRGMKSNEAMKLVEQMKKE